VHDPAAPHAPRDRLTDEAVEAAERAREERLMRGAVILADKLRARRERARWEREGHTP
jgi:hypothetical protein